MQQRVIFFNSFNSLIKHLYILFLFPFDKKIVFYPERIKTMICRTLACWLSVDLIHRSLRLNATLRIHYLFMLKCAKNEVSLKSTPYKRHPNISMDKSTILEKFWKPSVPHDQSSIELKIGILFLQNLCKRLDVSDPLLMYIIFKRNIGSTPDDLFEVNFAHISRSLWMTQR